MSCDNVSYSVYIAFEFHQLPSIQDDEANARLNHLSLLTKIDLKGFSAPTTSPRPQSSRQQSPDRGA